jgi:tetratricopeptide (TPR) repeat protein
MSKKINQVVLGLLVGLWFFQPNTLKARVPSHLEPQFSSASLAYREKDYHKALEVLNNLLEVSPHNISFLQLKALTLKASDRSAEALPLYESLVDLQKDDLVKTGPYHFEIGVIHYRNKEHDRARHHLQKSVEAGFNLGAAHFFLGMGAYERGNWNAAERHFQAVLNSNAEDLKTPAHFYLGQVYSQTRYRAGAVDQLTMSRSQAMHRKENVSLSPSSRQMAEQIYSASSLALAPFDQSQYFGNITVLSSYDSNVRSLPSSLPDEFATGKGSARQNMQLGIGYSSSPLGWIQVVPSYRSSLNYNFNKEAREAEYFSNILALNLNRNALQPSYYGLRLEGSYSFQNVSDIADKKSNRIEFEPFSYGALIEPYFSHEVIRKLHLGGALSINPQNNLATPGRSGTEIFLRTSLRWDAGSQFWNPSLGLVAGRRAAEEERYQMSQLSLNLANSLYLTERMWINLSGIFAYHGYDEVAADGRKDLNYNFRAGVVRRFKSSFSFLADTSYILNRSSLDEQFDFNRFTVSAGLSYSL